MNGRIGWMDLTRSMAISMVVLNHAVEYAWPLNALVFSQMSDGAAALRAGIFTLGRLGVPLFLFLSGALLLPRSVAGDSGVLYFYTAKLMPLLLTSEIWIIIYNLFMNWRSDVTFSFSSLLRKMLFLEQSDLQHMWYMAMLLGDLSGSSVFVISCESFYTALPGAADGDGVLHLIPAGAL